MQLRISCGQTTINIYNLFCPYEVFAYDVSGLFILSSRRTCFEEILFFVSVSRIWCNMIMSSKKLLPFEYLWKFQIITFSWKVIECWATKQILLGAVWITDKTYFERGFAIKNTGWRNNCQVNGVSHCFEPKMKVCWSLIPLYLWLLYDYWIESFCGASRVRQIMLQKRLKK